MTENKILGVLGLGWAVFFMTLSVARALPPEGLEAFGVLGKGQSAGSLFSSIGYENPAWTTDYETLQIYGGFMTPASNYVSLGGSTTAGSRFGDRDAFFVRYDLIFSETKSVAVKWVHDNWKYISTGRDAIGLDYNAYIDWSERSGMYFSFGGYYRWLKQRWNQPWWAPLTTNTEDREGFFQGCLGWKIPVWNTSFLTFDLNVRDPFNYYNADNVAWDFNFNFPQSEGFVWRWLLGVRTSAAWVGTAHPAHLYTFFGFAYY